MSIRKWETSKWCQRNSSGGSPESGHADSGGESPLVSVKHSERRSLTSECGYSPAWKTLKVVHINFFLVYRYLLHSNLCLFGVMQATEEESCKYNCDTVLSTETR